MIASLTALALAAASQPADAAIGRWKTGRLNGVVEIQRCGPSICGRIVTSDALRANPTMKDARNADTALRNRTLRGMPILGGFTADGDGWSGGTIYNPEDGKTYKAKVTPAGGDTLKVRGCVFVPLCKTQTWTRLR